MSWRFLVVLNVVPYRNPHSEHGICFDILDIVFASHAIMYDVFCKIVSSGLINTKFDTVVYWVPQRSQSKLCNDDVIM